jgi:glycosyltransferase involved in cell wall biosynthesis
MTAAPVVSTATTSTGPARRVAVVHEWIDAYAGSEQVFEALAQAFPEADLFALSHHPEVQLELDGRCVTTTFLDAPRLRDRRAATLPLMPLAWRRLGRRDYDLVITSHHAFAHSNRLTGPGGVHIAYVHTPARYIWTPELDGRGANPALVPARAALKRADRRATMRVDHYLANSREVANRIERCWGRTAQVVPPPVRVEFFADRADKSAARGGYVLGVGRWVPYKNLHLVVEAADIAGLPVKIAGRGPDAQRIRDAAARATVPVELIEAPSDERIRELLQGARCLVFPTVEDFGMVPVEAQAAGCPVVAPAAGGALDTIADGVSGVLTDSLAPAALARAVLETNALNPVEVALHAMQFSRRRFIAEIREAVTAVTAQARVPVS